MERGRPYEPGAARLSAGIRHENRLDTARLIMAALVLVSHSSQLIDGDGRREPIMRLGTVCSLGELAVIGFFVVSGHVIAASWENLPSYPAYMVKRVLRIYPAFVVACLFSVLVAGALGAVNVRGYFNGINWPGIVSGILTLRVPHPPETFASLPYPSVNGSVWTIHYEFLCYLLTPIVLYRKSTTLAAWLTTGVLTIILPFPLPRFLFAFLTGVGFFRMGEIKSRTALVLCSLLFPLSLFGAYTWEVGATLAGGYLLLFFGWRPHLLNWPDFSYGLYLYGWPVQMLLICYGIRQPVVVFFWGLSIASILGLASFYAIERPALRLKRSFLSGGVRGHAPMASTSPVKTEYRASDEIARVGQ